MLCLSTTVCAVFVFECWLVQCVSVCLSLGDGRKEKEGETLE